MALSPGTRLGPYEILTSIGAGGMGEVYRARDTRLSREVAVKVLPSQSAPTPEARERFEREARTISQLSHPHICVLHDVGREGQTEYLVMELLEGETLTDRLGRGPLPLEQALRFGADIASALAAAHARGIVHRDLKPGNVMLTRTGVKLLDFGLARALASPAEVSGLTEAPTMARDLTAEGSIVGTVAYMAPEQLEGRKTDARTDIFALGAVLYEMLTGRKAFSAGSHAALISAILTTEPPAVSSVQPIIPPELDRLVKTCLSKDPAERWQSAHDVELQLRSIGGSGATAGPIPAVSLRTPRRVLPWAVAAIAAAVAVVALIRGSRAHPAAQDPIRFVVLPPENGAFVFNSEGDFLAVSPDGKSLAYVASGGESAPSGLSPLRGTVRGNGAPPRVWIRPLDQIAARPLVGSERREVGPLVARRSLDRVLHERQAEARGSAGRLAGSDLRRGPRRRRQSRHVGPSNDPVHERAGRRALSAWPHREDRRPSSPPPIPRTPSCASRGLSSSPMESGTSTSCGIARAGET